MVARAKRLAYYAIARCQPTFQQARAELDAIRTPFLRRQQAVNAFSADFDPWRSHAVTFARAMRAARSGAPSHF
jgi:hypothetical protein